jgi:hypothetical protein
MLFQQPPSVLHVLKALSRHGEQVIAVERRRGCNSLLAQVPPIEHAKLVHLGGKLDSPAKDIIPGGLERVAELVIYSQPFLPCRRRPL